MTTARMTHPNEALASFLRDTGMAIADRHTDLSAAATFAYEELVREADPRIYSVERPRMEGSAAWSVTVTGWNTYTYTLVFSTPRRPAPGLLFTTFMPTTPAVLERRIRREKEEAK